MRPFEMFHIDRQHDSVFHVADSLAGAIREHYRVHPSPAAAEPWVAIDTETGTIHMVELSPSRSWRVLPEEEP